MTNQAAEKIGAQQEEVYTSKICELLRINPSSFTSLSTSKDPENFIEELQMVFEVMHIFNTERVELDTYQFKNVARNWFEQLKMDRAEGAQPASSTCFKEAF